VCPSYIQDARFLKGNAVSTTDSIDVLTALTFDFDLDRCTEHFLNQVRDTRQMPISSFNCAYWFPYMFRLPGAIFRGVTVSLFISYCRLSAFRVGVGYKLISIC
jgi:hypothetical protein